MLGRFGVWFEEKFKSATEGYIKVLRWELSNRGSVALITVGLLVASFALVPLGFIGSEFIAVADRGEFAVTIEMAPRLDPGKHELRCTASGTRHLPNSGKGKAS